MKLRQGFTLIELLVVVAIIGILITIAVPKFSKMTDGARKSATEANHRQIVSAVSMYIAAHNGITPNAQALLDTYLPPKGAASDGVAALKDKPEGSTYSFTYNADKSVTIKAFLDGATTPHCEWTS